MKFYLIGFFLFLRFGLLQSKSCGQFSSCPYNQKCNYDNNCECEDGYKWQTTAENDCVKRRDYCNFPKSSCSGLYNNCDYRKKKCSCIDGYKKNFDVCVKIKDYCKDDDECKKEHERCSKHVCSCGLSYERVDGVCKEVRTWKLIIIILIPLVAVACIAGVGFYIFRRMMIRRRRDRCINPVVLPYKRYN